MHNGEALRPLLHNLAAMLLSGWCISMAQAPTGVTKPPTRYVSVADKIIHASIDAGISPHVPLAIAWRESRFDQFAIHRNAPGRGADFGVFQLNTKTVALLHVARPLDAWQNVIAGVGLYAAYEKLCGSEHAAMRAYATGHCR